MNPDSDQSIMACHIRTERNMKGRPDEEAETVKPLEDKA